MTATIQQTIDELRRSLTDYIEATYHIGDPGMVEQRKRILATRGGIFQVPYIESTPRYVSGHRYEEMSGIPSAARDALVVLSRRENGKAVVFNPPYTHQEHALEAILGRGCNVMIMTGTGSGKTESFLLPILGKLAIEARESPKTFRTMPAMRAIVLYPMNALVNDQLSRLRLLFGNPRTVSLFEGWSGRPARFARYTSRTPYAGVRSPTKDGNRLGSFGDFFGSIEDAATRHRTGSPLIADEDEKASSLFARLGERGRWPSKPSVSQWFGKPGAQWRDRVGRYQRAVTGQHDAELLTRHEVQESPPDLLITNYSMLEYMMMRPIERPIFDRTKEWLADCPNEKLLIVLDEAHLYRGAQGAEVGLLLRRLRERLGIGPDRFQVICATASFSDEGKARAGEFGAQLSGLSASSFVPVQGKLALRSPAAQGSVSDVDLLAAIDLTRFYSDNADDQLQSVKPFLDFRKVSSSEGDNKERSLFQALDAYPPLNLLVNETMSSAVPLAELGHIIFGAGNPEQLDRATTALLAMASQARPAPGQPSLLPCRVHSFFRGLPGLWVCMNPDCTELHAEERNGFAGKLHAQPLERCPCGAPVLEYFTCRHCGTSYARAYTDDVRNPHLLWPLPGDRLQTDAGLVEELQPLDLLLEEPSKPEWGVAAHYDLNTGRLNDNRPTNQRIVHVRPDHKALADEHPKKSQALPGQFTPCGCCGKGFIFGQSSVQDHLTKGDQPFQAILGTQIRVQPPGPQAATNFAPLRGRKVLVFSDSRQVAARLAPRLKSYSLQDTVRALLPAGYKMLAADLQFGPSLVLEHAPVAVLVAAHRFGVRVRPELDSGEMTPTIEGVPPGQIPTGADLFRLMTTSCPANLMRAIIKALDEPLGLEQLAIASIIEAPRLRSKVEALPALPGLATDPAEKLAVARAWLRCWHRQVGSWFDRMPVNWWTTEVRTHKGVFDAMDRVLVTREAKKVFNTTWLPRLLNDFTRKSEDGGTRLLASNMSLEIGGEWRRCLVCKSVHRPIANLTTCVDCGSPRIVGFDPAQDEVFRARRGFYRDPIAEALTSNDPELMSLIAAEHTAQLGTAQADDAFSQAENHELRFQDIDLAWRDTDAREEAIDILSSTTTMEVGIDIGELSGVALRNMPPARANYQQRAGRAGRRGTAVATVVAFGSSDSHDDHYFSAPDEMIRGPVTDPRLTLENQDIARRHLRAFLLQRYHEAKIPGFDPGGDPNLFSVLGSVRDFRLGTGALNRIDLAKWLQENEAELREAANRWLPSELSPEDRLSLIQNMTTDVCTTVDDAIDYAPGSEPVPAATEPEAVPGRGEDAAPEEAGEAIVGTPEDSEIVDPSTDKLLDRLLYRGVLPRYAFPTDVASFYVFNRAQSTAFRPRMDFTPSQGLNVALSQYAPNKQIWIKDKQYTSKAIYSPYRNDRRDAWGKKRLYYECTHCGHAKTNDYVKDKLGETIRCDACQHDTLGPAMPWFRPPGFAHPIDLDPVTVPDAPNETAFATRAKLVMPTPAPDKDWVRIGERVRGFPTRRNLLVSNSGPEGKGYHYCVACGRIESVSNPEINLHTPHERPFRSAEKEPCPGMVSSHIVLGTDFITDIALFSLPLDDPFRVRPGNDESAMALRTACEALAKAACNLLQLEAGEILAEYRPALTDAGAEGLEAEIFLYDTLAGGAGFAPQLVSQGDRLFAEALRVLSSCPNKCDASCYRCLRSFRNKLDHSLLDRKLGEQFLRHALEGGYPEYEPSRVASSLKLLADDLSRQFGQEFEFELSKPTTLGGKAVLAPLLATRRTTGMQTCVCLTSPIAPEVPIDAQLRDIASEQKPLPVDDLLIRRNLPRATENTAKQLS